MARRMQPAQLSEKTLPTARLVCKHHKIVESPQLATRVLDLAHGKYVLMLDDDTVVQAQAFDRLIDYLEHHPDVGLCGPKLIDGGRPSPTDLSFISDPGR